MFVIILIVFVLGVTFNQKPDMASGSSLNDAPLAVTVYYGAGVTDKPSNTGGFVYTFGSYTGGNVNYKMQIAWETLSTNVHYIRTCSNNVWTTWEVIGQSIPAFYKNYSTISALASAVGGIIEGGDLSNKNLNDYMTSSTYIVRNSCSNLPSETASALANYLCVIKMTENTVLQIVTTYGTDKMFIRYSYWTGRQGEAPTWNNWHEIF